MTDDYLKKIFVAMLFVAIAILSFLILKPILTAIIIGFLLTFIFSPVYKWLYKILKSKNLAAAIICLLLIVLILAPFWFLTPILVDQSIKIYMASQTLDFVTPLKSIFPSLFASSEFSSEIGSILHSFVTKLANSLTNILSNLFLNFPTILLQTLVVFFTFFFMLKDQDEFVDYIRSLSPFSKEIDRKFFEYSKGITSSVLYGQVIIGFVQGVVVGLGFFLFGVPNALILTLVAVGLGILPIVGTMIVWLPVLIYLLIHEQTFAAIGILVLGIISSNLDNLLRPVFVSKKIDMHPALVLIAMIGGFFLFGILGIILGPLIIAYLLIIIELYRKKETPGLFLQH